jgi:hypothetical protein
VWRSRWKRFDTACVGHGPRLLCAILPVLLCWQDCHPDDIEQTSQTAAIVRGEGALDNATFAVSLAQNCE